MRGFFLYIFRGRESVDWGIFFGFNIGGIKVDFFGKFVRFRVGIYFRFVFLRGGE